jgi:hypothetical protein
VGGAVSASPFTAGIAADPGRRHRCEACGGQSSSAGKRVSRSRRCLCFTDRGLATSQRAWALSAERWSLLVRMRADIEPLGQVNSGKRCRSVDCRYHAEDGLSLASRAQRLTAAPGCRRARHPIPGVARAAADGKAATHGLLARHDLLADPSATASTRPFDQPLTSRHQRRTPTGCSPSTA